MIFPNLWKHGQLYIALQIQAFFLFQIHWLIGWLFTQYNDSPLFLSYSCLSTMSTFKSPKALESQEKQLCFQSFLIIFFQYSFACFGETMVTVLHNLQFQFVLVHVNKIISYRFSVSLCAVLNVFHSFVHLVSSARPLPFFSLLSCSVISPVEMSFLRKE